MIPNLVTTINLNLLTSGVASMSDIQNWGTRYYSDNCQN